MTDDDFELLFPRDISDETATILCNFLYALVTECENRFFTQIRRYRPTQHAVALGHPWIFLHPED